MFTFFVKIRQNTETRSPRKRDNPKPTKTIIAPVPITFDVTRISWAEVRFLIFDAILGELTVNSFLLFCIDSSRVWFTPVQTQMHDVVFITIFVTFFVEGAGFVGAICVVSVVVVVGVVVVGVVVVGVVFEVAKHESGLVIGFFIA